MKRLRTYANVSGHAKTVNCTQIMSMACSTLAYLLKRFMRNVRTGAQVLAVDNKSLTGQTAPDPLRCAWGCPCTPEGPGTQDLQSVLDGSVLDGSCSTSCKSEY